jgi:hypothetical protein
MRGTFSWGECDEETAPIIATVQALLNAGAHAAPTEILGKREEYLTVRPMSMAVDALRIDVESGTEVFKLLMDANYISSFAASPFWSSTPYQDSEVEIASLFKWTLNRKYASSLGIESRKKIVSFIAQFADFSEEEFVSHGEVNGEIFQFTDAINDLVKSAADYGQTNLIKDLIDKKVDPEILCKGLPVAADWG